MFVLSRYIDLVHIRLSSLNAHLTLVHLQVLSIAIKFAMAIGW